VPDAAFDDPVCLFAEEFLGIGTGDPARWMHGHRIGARSKACSSQHIEIAGRIMID
jgi:hypothetical protein